MALPIRWSAHKKLLRQGTESERTAAGKGDADLDLFGQTAAVRIKRGTAKRGTPGWAKAMTQAKRQAKRYANP